MNAPEKKILYLALFLFVFGVVVRYLPWGLPTIEMIQLEETLPSFTNKVAKSEGGGGVVPRVEEVLPDSTLETYKMDNYEKKSKKTKKTVQLPLHINVASLHDLCALKGVGPKLAQKIIDVREASGPFKTGQDLQKVPGIGKKKLETILPDVIFD